MKLFCRKSKKGTVLDIIPILILLTLLGVGVLVGEKIMSEAKTNLVDEGGLDSTVGQNIMSAKATSYSQVFDLVIPLIFVGLSLGMIISAFLIKSHPFFFIIMICLLALLLLIAPVFSNIYGQACDQLSDECDKFDKANYILDYMPFLLMLGGIVTIIVLYAVFKS